MEMWVQVSWIAVVGLIITIGLALFVMAVVAVSAGRLGRPNSTRWERVIDETNRHLNAEGDVPGFLGKLDQPRR